MKWKGSKENEKNRVLFLKEKEAEFKNKGVITYGEWKKIKEKWVFKQTTLKLSAWEKKIVQKYFKKYNC